MEYFYSILIYNDRFWILWLEIDKIHKNILLILLEFNIKIRQWRLFAYFQYIKGDIAQFYR